MAAPQDQPIGPEPNAALFVEVIENAVLPTSFESIASVEIRFSL
jgi:hypothetical protein